jgi:CheY-like chemotaxis protein
MDSRPSQGRAILLVEDDPDIREAIHDVLTEEGYDVAVADTGLQALDRLRGGEPLPDLILLDLMMPVMDGWQFRAEQKRHPDWSAIPVIVLSAVGNTHEKADSIGALGCLRKPLDIDELLEMLARALPGDEARLRD